MNLDKIQQRITTEIQYSVHIQNLIELYYQDNNKMKKELDNYDFWTSLDLLLKTQLRKNKKR